MGSRSAGLYRIYAVRVHTSLEASAFLVPQVRTKTQAARRSMSAVASYVQSAGQRITSEPMVYRSAGVVFVQKTAILTHKTLDLARALPVSLCPVVNARHATLGTSAPTARTYCALQELSRMRRGRLLAIFACMGTSVIRRALPHPTSGAVNALQERTSLIPERRVATCALRAN